MLRPVPPNMWLLSTVKSPSGCVWLMGPGAVRGVWRCSEPGAGARCVMTDGAGPTRLWSARSWAVVRHKAWMGNGRVSSPVSGASGWMMSDAEGRRRACRTAHIVCGDTMTAPTMRTLELCARIPEHRGSGSGSFRNCI